MSDRPDDRTSFWPLVLLFLAVGLLIRFWSFGDLNLAQWDEGPYVGYAMDKGPCVRQDPLIVYAPPLYPWLCGIGYAMFGENPRVGIGVAALIGALCILFGALLTRRWFGPLAGVCAAALLAFEPLLITYSRMALTETTFTCGALATLWLGARALETRTTVDAALFGAAAGLSTMAKFHGFLPLVTAGIGVLIELATRGGPDFQDAASCFRSRFKTLLVAGLTSIPFAVVVVWFVVEQMGLPEFSESRKTWVEGLHLYTISGTGQFIAATALLFGSVGTVALGVLGAVLALPKLRRAATSSSLIYLAILLLVLITYRNYTRLIVPFFAVLTPLAAYAAVVIAQRFAPTHARLIALAITLLAAATGAENAHEAVAFHGDGYPKMAERLTEQLRAEPGPTVAVAQQSIYPYLDHDVIDQVWSITEPKSWRLLETGELRYLLTDQDPARHFRVKPHFAGVAPRLELIATIDNPLAPALLFDRLDDATFERMMTEPDAADLAPERELRLFRVTTP